MFLLSFTITPSFHIFHHLPLLPLSPISNVFFLVGGGGVVFLWGFFSGGAPACSVWGGGWGEIGATLSQHHGAPCDTRNPSPPN